MEAFTYSVSHDLRAPLRHIDGFSRILLNEAAGQLSDSGRRALDASQTGSWLTAPAPWPRPLAPPTGIPHFVGIGRGVVSPSVIPMTHFTPSIHIFWISGRSQTSSRCPSDE